MKLHLPSLLLGGLLIASFAVNLHASAQTTPTVPLTPDPLDVPPPATEVVIGEWVFDMPANQPFAVFPISVQANLNGHYTTITAAVRHPDDSVVGLTECDNIAVICRPMDVQAVGALGSADPTDVFVLADEGS